MLRVRLQSIIHIEEDSVRSEPESAIEYSFAGVLRASRGVAMQASGEVYDVDFRFEISRLWFTL